jgi:hypothetical protein
MVGPNYKEKIMKILLMEKLLLLRCLLEVNKFEPFKYTLHVRIIRTKIILCLKLLDKWNKKR